MMPNLDMPRRLPSEVDLTLLWSGLFLLLLGMVMVYSSSIAIAEASRMASHNPAHYLLRHAVFLAVGLVAAGVALWIGIGLLALLAYPFLMPQRLGGLGTIIAIGVAVGWIAANAIGWRLLR